MAGLWLSAGQAAAQQAIVGPQDAVVTGFSGVAPGSPPAGADPLDYLVIPPDGPSARVVDLSALGQLGTLTNAQKPFTVTAGQVGQVFGVTLDDAQAPSIYLAASSAYGLSIGLADPATGTVKRLQHGLTGAAFIPGMFGPAENGGGPGSIWRVDGVTGQVNLFANIGAPGDDAAAGLGGLAYDPRSQQIFAVDRSTGLIHRLGLDGADHGTFDHGVDGRRAGGLADVPLVPAAVDVTSSAFDTEQPASWGYAAPERLVFGLAVRNGRLYYSVAAGPEIWSVGIAEDGSFGRDARFEVAVPSLQPGVEISSITFDGRGLLYAAERAPPTGAYDFRSVAQGGSERVLRFRAKPRPDSNPGLWLPAPDEYAIGLAPQFRNADGGVALGRGYARSGRIQTATCGVTVWSTGERLLGDGGSTDPVDGLQGNDTQLVLPSNAPPQQSWFIDYDDRAGDPQASGHMGAVVTLPCGPPAQRATTIVPFVPFVPPMAPPILVSCPPGTYLQRGVCLLPPQCPPGTDFRDGYCVAFGCPPDMIRRDGQCVPPPQRCDRYETYVDGRCLPWRCPPDMVRQQNGYCGCPRGEFYDRGECRPPRCPPDMVQGRDGQCFCPPDLTYRNGRCVPPPRPCPPGLIYGRDGQCVCPPDLIFRDGRCVPPPHRCPPGMTPGPNDQCMCPPDLIFRDGRCVPPPHRCPPGMTPGPNDQCMCPPDLIFRDGRCVPPPHRCPPGMTPGPNDQCMCPPDTINRDGRCIPPPRPCPDNGIRGNDGKCVPPIEVCPGGQPKDRNGRCRPLPGQCPPGQNRDDNGRCVFPPRPCPGGALPVNGQCRPPTQPDCGPGEIRLRGRCIPNRIQDPVKIKPDQPIKPIKPIRPIEPLQPIKPIKPDRGFKPERPIKIEPDRTFKAPDRIIRPERQFKPENRQQNFVKPDMPKQDFVKPERQFNRGPEKGQGGGCRPGMVRKDGECRPGN